MTTNDHSLTAVFHRPTDGAPACVQTAAEYVRGIKEAIADLCRGAGCDCGYCFSCNAAYAAYANQIRRGFRPDTDYAGEKNGTRWAVMPAHFSDEYAVAASGLFGWEGGPWFADFPTVRRSPGRVLVKRREGLDV